MTRMLVIGAFLCAVAWELVQADSQLPSPVALTSSDGLYTLWKINTSVYLNSTKENFKPCTISIDPADDLTLIKIQAEELLDHKLIVWGSRSCDVPNSENFGMVDCDYIALIIDTSSCSYKTISFPEDKKPSGDALLLMTRVVPSADGFDLFYPTFAGKCLPCRFSYQGESVPSKYQLKTERHEFELSSFNIQPVDKNDLSKGYISTRNFNNETAVMQHLDYNFKATKQVLFRHPIHQLSINYDKQPIISICYGSQNSADSFEKYNFTVKCERLDSDFKSKLTVRLPVTDHYFVFGLMGITHKVDSAGNMFIGLIEQNVRIPMTRHFRFFVIDKTGKIVETRDYDEMKSLGEFHLLELHSHLFVDKKFCIVTHRATPSLPHNVNSKMTCFDVSKSDK